MDSVLGREGVRRVQAVGVVGGDGKKRKGKREKRKREKRESRREEVERVRESKERATRDFPHLFNCRLHIHKEHAHSTLRRRLPGERGGGMKKSARIKERVLRSFGRRSRPSLTFLQFLSRRRADSVALLPLIFSPTNNALVHVVACGHALSTATRGSSVGGSDRVFCGVRFFFFFRFRPIALGGGGRGGVGRGVTSSFFFLFHGHR